MVRLFPTHLFLSLSLLAPVVRDMISNLLTEHRSTSSTRIGQTRQARRTLYSNVTLSLLAAKIILQSLPSPLARHLPEFSFAAIRASLTSFSKRSAPMATFKPSMSYSPLFPYFYTRTQYSSNTSLTLFLKTKKLVSSRRLTPFTTLARVIQGPLATQMEVVKRCPLRSAEIC